MCYYCRQDYRRDHPDFEEQVGRVEEGYTFRGPAGARIETIMMNTLLRTINTTVIT